MTDRAMRTIRLTDRGRRALGLGPAPTVETVGVPLFDPIPDDVLAWIDRQKSAEDRAAMQDEVVL